MSKIAQISLILQIILCKQREPRKKAWFFFCIDWEQRKLGEIANIQKGQQLGKAEMNDHGYYYVLNGGIEPSGFSDRYNTPANTISISEGGNSCGYVTFNLECFWSGGHNYTLQNPQLDTIYLYQWLKKQEKTIMALRVGSGLPNIQKSALQDVVVLYPNNNEQRMIATILMRLDNLITLHQRKDMVVQYEKKAIGGNVEKQKMANDWEQRKVGELSEKTYGGGTPSTQNEGFWNGEIPWIQSSDIEEGRLYGVTPKKFISQDGLNQSAAQLIPKNSIAIITRVGVGKLAFMPFSYATSQDFVSLSRLTVDPFFTVYACYRRLQTDLNSVQGTSIKGITKEELLSKVIFFPDEPEQRLIGGLFRRLDDLITLHQRKRKGEGRINLNPHEEEEQQKSANDWEQRKVGDVVEVQSGRDYKHLGSGSIPVYGTGGLMLYVDKALSYSNDAIGIGRKGTIDKPYVLRAPFWTVDTLFYAVPKAKNDLSFVYCLFQRIDWKSKDESTGVPSLSKQTINDSEVKVAAEQEQRTIGAYFSKLDDLITLHQRKDMVVQYEKKAIGGNVEKQKMANDWEQRKLGDLVERVVRKNTNNESTLPLTISAQYGLVDQFTYFNNRVASRDVSNYYLLYKGEFAYNKSTSDGFPFGTVKRLDFYEKGVLSTLYIVFSIKKENQSDSDFLTVFFDTDRWHKGISERAAEGARNHGLLNISADDFFDIDLTIPKNKGEQTAIGRFIRCLDDLITLHQRKGKTFYAFKKQDKSAHFRRPNKNGWEQRKLGEVGAVAMCKRIFKEQTTEEGDIPFFKIGTFGGEADAFISRELFEEYKSKYPYPSKGAILISASGSIGRTVEFTGKNEYFQDSNIVWLTHDDRLQDSFLKYLYATITWAGIEGSTIKRLYNDNILKTQVMIPSSIEQTKLGTLFSRLDNLITLHQRE